MPLNRLSPMMREETLRLGVWVWLWKVHTSGLMLCLGNGSLMQLFMVRLLSLYAKVWVFEQGNGSSGFMFA